MSDASHIGAKLRPLGFKTYAAYLRSAHWQHVKQRYRESGRTQRCVCGAPGTDLHHLTYARLGREKLSDLVLLCRPCHAKIHGKKPLTHRKDQRPQKRKRKRHRAAGPPDWTEAYRQERGASESAAIAADAGHADLDDQWTAA